MNMLLILGFHASLGCRHKWLIDFDMNIFKQDTTFSVLSSFTNSIHNIKCVH